MNFRFKNYLCQGCKEKKGFFRQGECQWKNLGNTDNLEKPRKILNDSQNNTSEKCVAVDFLKKSFKPCKKDNLAIDIKFILIYYFFIVIFNYEILKNGLTINLKV